MRIVNNETNVRQLFQSFGVQNYKAFYVHDGQYINEIVKNEGGLGYIIHYANGNISDVVSGDTKVTVLDTSVHK